MSGNRIYFPNSTQFKRINENLKAIAGAMNRNIDISTWAGIQKAVRSGIAPSLLPVGTQLTIEHDDYGVCVYDVVAHDYFKSAIDENAHTMTLMSHEVLPRIQYDSTEAFYHADEELPAGTYNFDVVSSGGMWMSGTYQFTLDYSVPKGGILAISGNYMSYLDTLKVVACRSQTDDFSSEMVAITKGSGGTKLGTIGVELNHWSRVAYGSDNYKESAIRQFLNSSERMGNVWSPQTKYDRPPIWLTNIDGFMAGLDDEFLSVVGAVVVPCSSNKMFESQDSTTKPYEQYNVVDKFYPASQQEIFGIATDIVEDNSHLLPYYDGATNTERIKYRDDSAVAWRLRTPRNGYGCNVRLVGTDGTLRNDFANLEYGVAPMCTIV